MTTKLDPTYNYAERRPLTKDEIRRAEQQRLEFFQKLLDASADDSDDIKIMIRKRIAKQKKLLRSLL